MRKFLSLIFLLLISLSLTACIGSDESIGIIGGADGPTAILVTDGKSSISFVE